VTLIFNNAHLKHATFCRTSFTSLRLWELNFDRLWVETFGFAILKVLKADALPVSVVWMGTLEEIYDVGLES
jgi:hypothetical protein